FIAMATVFGLVPLALAMGRRMPITNAVIAHSHRADRTFIALALIGLAAGGIQVLNLPPFTFDDWFYVGIGSRLSEADWTTWGSAFTAHVHPTEPTLRPLTYWLLGGAFTIGGDHWWAWRLMTIATHLGATALLYQCGRKLTGSARAGLFGAFIWCVHPAHIEVIGWLSAIEMSWLALAYFGALAAYLHDRLLLALALTLVTFIIKEAGATLIGAFALVDLVRFHRIRFRPLAGPVVLLALTFVWRTAIAEPDNLAMAAYLTDMTSTPPLDFARALFITGPRIALQPFGDGVLLVAGMDVGPAVLLVAGASLVWLAFSAARRDQKGALTWLGFGVLWAVGISLPAAWDMEIAQLGRPEVAPPWKLRHTYIGLAGPALAAGWLLTRSGSERRVRVVSVMAIGLCGLVFALSAGPVVNAGARSAGALAEFDQRQPSDNIGVRVIEGTDPIGLALSYRRVISPEKPSTSVLVGEPRCGCAVPPLGPEAPGSTLREFAEWMLAPASITPIDPGGACTCERWRADARWIRYGPEGFEWD
ncbi:MAG: hypothetical protein ACI9OJ_000479, partial [Myxococcota bacterium]